MNNLPFNNTLELKNNGPSVDGGISNTDNDTLSATAPLAAPGPPNRLPGMDDKPGFKLPEDDEENESKREVDH